MPDSESEISDRESDDNFDIFYGDDSSDSDNEIDEAPVNTMPWFRIILLYKFTSNSNVQ